jgi:hypothetical protein
LIEHEIPRDRRKVGMDAAAESGEMNGPLGDESKMNQHLASNVILMGCETYELEEAYKILMLTGVDLRFSGLTRELQPAVWARIRQVPWEAAIQRPVLIDSVFARGLRACSVLASIARRLRSWLGTQSLSIRA